MNSLLKSTLGILRLCAIAAALGSPAAHAITPAEQQNLQKLLECRTGVNYKLLDATIAREKISRTGGLHTLKAPIRIFGFPTQKISLFMDSGENSYQAYMEGHSMQDLIRAAKLTKDSGFYGRRAPGGFLDIETYEGLSFRCSINLEGE